MRAGNGGGWMGSASLAKVGDRRRREDNDDNEKRGKGGLSVRVEGLFDWWPFSLAFPLY